MGIIAHMFAFVKWVWEPLQGQEAGGGEIRDMGYFRFVSWIGQRLFVPMRSPSVLTNPKRNPMRALKQKDRLCRYIYIFLFLILFLFLFLFLILLLLLLLLEVPLVGLS